MNTFLHAVAAIGIALLGSATLYGQDNAQLSSLDERITKLERAVIRDVYHPDDTALARLKKIEDRLDAHDKAGGAAAKADVKDEDHVRLSLDALNQDMKAIDQRLKRMEDASRRTEPAASAGDLREIKNSLTQLTRSLGDLQDRVRKLELRK